MKLFWMTTSVFNKSSSRQESNLLLTAIKCL